MKYVDIIGSFMAGIITLAAISLIVAPKSNVAQVVESLGNAAANLVTVAKAYPAGQ